MRTVNTGMEPEVDQDAGGILIDPGRVADFDLDAVENPILIAILAGVQRDEVYSGRSFNNFVS
jgi:hypothetical protein